MEEILLDDVYHRKNHTKSINIEFIKNVMCIDFLRHLNSSDPRR